MAVQPRVALKFESEARRGDMVDQAMFQREAELEVLSLVARRAVEDHGTLAPGQMIEPRECGNPHCGKEISEVRLKAVPKAKYCKACQEYLEAYKVLPRES